MEAVRRLSVRHRLTLLRGLRLCWVALRYVLSGRFDERCLRCGIRKCLCEVQMAYIGARQRARRRPGDVNEAKWAPHKP